MIQPPFMWLGADAIAEYVAWQTAEQAERDRALIAVDACPVVVDDGE